MKLYKPLITICCVLLFVPFVCCHAETHQINIDFKDGTTATFLVKEEPNMTFNSGVCKFNIEDKYYYFELCKIETGVFISLKELSSGVYIINWRDSAIKIYK